MATSKEKLSTVSESNTHVFVSNDGARLTSPQHVTYSKRLLICFGVLLLGVAVQIIMNSPMENIFLTIPSLTAVCVLFAGCVNQFMYDSDCVNMHMPMLISKIPYLGQSFLFLSFRPWDLLTAWHERYGPMLGFQLLGTTFISVAHPELLKGVLQSKIQSVKKDIYFTYKNFLVILGTGIVTSEGKSWMQQRMKLSVPLRHDVLELIPPITLLAIQRFMETLDEACETQKPVDLSTALRHLTLQVISGTFLSISADESDSTFADMYLPIVDESNTRVWYPYRSYMFIFPYWWMYHYNVYRLNAYVSKLIKQRWEQRQKDPIRHNDMLDKLLDWYQKHYGDVLTQEGLRQLRDEMKTFLLAGHETSASMMTWAFYELMEDTKIRNQVAQEGDAVFNPKVDWKTAANLPNSDELSKLIFAEACLKEALRKYAVVPLVARHTVEPVTLDNPTNSKAPAYFLPKGTTVLINIQAVHHNAEYWPNPMKYDPNRFLPSSPPPKPFTFLPFIAGPRNCLGQYLSLLESKIVLGMLTQRYQFTLPKGEVLSTKDWANVDPRHSFMIPVCPQKDLLVQVSRKHAV